jgi:hypothetical protein
VIFAKWKSGCRINADAQKVADEILSIGQSASPTQILDKARDENTELHKCFEWDDAKAAERWRIQQARTIVCNLVIKEEKEGADAPKQEIRVFYKTDNDSGYKPTFLIVRDKDEYQKLLGRALAELNSFRAKYKALAELDGVFTAIDQLAG